MVLASTSAPAPASSAHPATASGGSAATSTAPASKLATLAALIQTSDAPLPGNASLEIARQVNGGRLMQVVYALYTDSGRLYLGDDKQTLMAEVADNANQADFTNAREIAAARYAATGNLAAAVKQMVEALPNDYYDSLAERKAIWAKTAAAREQLEKEKGMKTPIPMPTGRLLQQDIDNTLWTASTIVLSWGAGDPQIRVGRAAPAVDPSRGHRRRFEDQRAANADHHGRAGAVRRGQRRPGADGQRADRDTGQLGRVRRRAAHGGGNRPGLPGDGGRHRGRQVLTGSGAERPGLRRT